jgi:AcrR family transcriptional regulator
MAERQARAEATRRTIIDAAVELFGTVGYGDTDMTDVVERAKTSGGTCYYYFPNKSSLAHAIIEHSNAGIAAAMGPIWESEAPPMHRLISATFSFIDVTQTNPAVRVGYQLRQALRQVSEAGSSGGFGDTEVVFASAIKRAVADGHARADINPKEAAYTLFAALVGCRLLADANSDNPYERLAQAWRTILRSIAPEDAQPGLIKFVATASRKRSSVT